jgi:hypothetical protein
VNNSGFLLENDLGDGPKKSLFWGVADRFQPPVEGTAPSVPGGINARKFPESDDATVGLAGSASLGAGGGPICAAWT